MLSLSTTPIRDIMIKDVITIDRGISLSKAAEKMLHYHVGCLVVMDGLKPVGIVTERDFVNLVKNGEASSTWLIADDIIPEKLITVTPSASFSKVFKLLNTYNIKRIPVVQKGKLKGLITIRQMSVFSRNALINALDKNRSLQKEANQDVLTGAYNKRYFLRKLDSEFKRVHNLGIRSSLLFLDIDHFKQVNDEFSHSAGDYVLKHLYKILKKFERSTDIIARFGGEEFVILLRYTKSYDAVRIASKIRIVFKNYPFSWQKKQFQSTLSIGVASLPSASSAKQALERADQAMYHAKAIGRDRVCRWQSSTNTIVEVGYRYKI